MQRTKNMIGISLVCLAGLASPAAVLAGGYHKGVFSGFEMPAGNKAKAPIKVSGTVVDEAGKPIEGVSIVTKTGSTSGVTDFKGNFSFTVEEGATLVFSSAGYVSQELTAAAEMKVELKTDFKENETVVAIGYTKQRKSDLTGAISSVKAGEMNLTSPTLSQALVGKVAGVQVSQVSGAPYAGTKIRVRGTGSINASSEPLYVVDGYAVGGNTSAGPGNGGTGTTGYNANTNGNDLFINPDDIESIEVLKDAASAAIYGSRAAAGVVLITTKRGKLGKGKFEYNTQVSVNQLAKKVKLMNSREWAELFVDGRNGAYRDALEAQGVVWDDAYYSDDNATRTAKTGGNQIIPYLYDFPTQTVLTPEFDTDWQDVVYRNAFSHRHTLSFSGGKEGLRYAISGGYQDAPGIMRETYMKRTNFRANIDGEISKKFRVAANVSYTGTNAREAQEGRFHQGVVMNTLLMMPIFPVYNADGSLQIGQTSQRVDGYTFAIQGTENPLAMLERIKTTRQGNRATFNGTATYDIARGLSAKINLGTQQYSEKYEYYYPTNLASGENPPGSAAAINAARAVAQNMTLTDRMAEFTLNYNKEFGKSKLDLLAGYSAQETVSDILAFTGSNFSNDLIPEITGRGADAASLSMNGNTGKNVTTLISYLGRAMYNYDSRYFLSASIRADASSRFGPENRWGYFPSISAGWSVSDEKFYNNWLGEASTLKMRASWGLSGNNNIGNYQYAHLLGTPGGTVIGGSVVNAAWPGRIADPALGWESTSQFNIGADIGLFGGRINLIANYYNGRSFNLLYLKNIAALGGTTQYYTNLKNSDIRNIGYDFQLDARVIRTKDFSLNASGNIMFNKNEVRSLDGASELRNAGAERSYITHITREGDPIGMFFGHKVAGMVRESDMANIAADNAVYIANGNSFPKGYVLQGPPRSVGYSTTPLKPGDLYFTDRNGDGVVNELDKDVIGSPYPKFTYGFNISADYKDFSLSMSFNGSYGNTVLDGQDYYLRNMEGSGNQYKELVNRYRSEAEPGNGYDYRASRGGTQSNSTRLSDYYLQDGSYFRCTNISLGYNLGAIKSLTVSNLRITASVDNAFTVTKYLGYNPEVDYNNGSNLTPGVDYGKYPLMRGFNLGARLTF